MTFESSRILAIGFVTWAFFWAGLAAVSIPIIIHILNRRRFRTVTWAAMDFLLRAMKKNRRRLRFEQWLLLATRCLVVFFLGMALARPLACENRSLAGVGGKTGLNVFVIDNSYSMAYEANRPGDARTHLDQAKKIAKALLAQMNSGGESVAIITSSRPAAAVPGFEKPSYNLVAAASAVDRVEQTYGGTDLLGALQLAMRIGREDLRQPVKNLFVLSDATRSAWEQPGEGDALKGIGHDLAKLFRVTHYSLSQGIQQWNQAALDVRPTANLVTTKFHSDFAAVLKGFGPGPDATLAWTMNDTRLPDGPPVRLDADTPPQLQTKAQPKGGGPQVVSVSVTTNDPLDMDNTRWRVVDVAAALRVLIVEGERGVDALEGSGAFLQLALSPPADAPGTGGAAGGGIGAPKTSSYVASELISDLELGNKVLGDYRAVILAGVGQLPATQADALQHFVQQGGTLMMFMGEPVDAQNYNSVLLPRKLVPGPLVKRMQVAADQKAFVFDFNPKGVNHPLLREFSNQENTGLDTAQVFTYWQVDPAADLQVERVLNYRPGDAPTTRPGNVAPGDPAITVHSLGQGRVVFVSTTADSDWATLSAKPAYVALMHELLAGSVRTGDGWMNRATGQPLEIPPTVRLTATPTLLDPSKNPVVMEAADAGSGQTVYRSRPLVRPGVYTLNTGSGIYPIAVNVPADEADVRTLSDDAMRQALGGVEITARGAEVPAVAGGEERGNDLSWAFMAAVFALLAVECFMAMRFGHYRRADHRAVGPAR
jgi:Mg-chelatase subunit ChlD